MVGLVQREDYKWRCLSKEPLYGVLASLVSVLLAWPLVNILVKVCLYLFLF